MLLQYCVFCFFVFVLLYFCKLYKQLVPMYRNIFLPVSILFFLGVLTRQSCGVGCLVCFIWLPLSGRCKSYVAPVELIGLMLIRKLSFSVYSSYSTLSFNQPDSETRAVSFLKWFFVRCERSKSIIISFTFVFYQHLSLPSPKTFVCVCVVLHK